MSNTSCITHIHLCFKALISGHVRISFVFFPLLFLVYSDPKNRFMHHLWTPLGSRPFGLTNFKDRSKDPTGSSSSVSSRGKNKCSEANVIARTLVFCSTVTSTSAVYFLLLHQVLALALWTWVLSVAWPTSWELTALPLSSGWWTAGWLSSIRLWYGSTCDSLLKTCCPRNWWKR